MQLLLPQNFQSLPPMLSSPAVSRSFPYSSRWGEYLALRTKFLLCAWCPLSAEDAAPVESYSPGESLRQAPLFGSVGARGENGRGAVSKHAQTIAE